MIPVNRLKEVPDLPPIAARLRRILIDRDIKLRELAEATGIDQPRLSMYCLGKITPRLDNLKLIAKSLGMTVDEFINP